MNRAHAFLLAAAIVASSLIPALAGTATAFAAACPTPVAEVTLPVTVTIPDIGQGNSAEPVTPTPPGCTPPPQPGGPTPGGSTPGSGSKSGGSTSNGGAAPAAPAPGGPAGEVFAPTPPSVPSKNAAKLELDPQQLAVHEWMTATGNTYTAGEKVQLVMYPGAVVIGSYEADASGNVTARFRIPDETRPGSHVIEATGWVSKRVSNGEFTVITVAGTGAISPLWWVIILCGALFIGLLVTAIYFRRSIASAFRGAPPTVASTP